MFCLWCFLKIIIFLCFCQLSPTLWPEGTKGRAVPPHDVLTMPSFLHCPQSSYQSPLSKIARRKHTEIYLESQQERSSIQKNGHLRERHSLYSVFWLLRYPHLPQGCAISKFEKLPQHQSQTTFKALHNLSHLIPTSLQFHPSPSLHSPSRAPRSFYVFVHSLGPPRQTLY